MANAADAYVLAAKLLSMADEMAGLRARLAEAERLLRELPVACACECLSDVKDAVDSFLRAADNGNEP